MQMCIESMGAPKASRMLYGAEIQSSLSQSCQNYSTWTECSSEKHNSCQHQHFPLPKGWRFTTKLGKKKKKRPFGSQVLEAVTLLSYDMPIETESHTSSARQSGDKQCLTVSLQAVPRKPLGLKCCWMLPWPLQNGPEIYSRSRMPSEEQWALSAWQ